MIARTSSGAWVKGVADMFAAEGLAVEDLFDLAGLDFATLNDPAMRFLIDDVSLLWELAVARSGKATLGLSRELTLTFGNFDVVAYAMLTCQTLLEGLERLARYMNVVSDAATFVLTPAAGGCWLELGHLGGERPVPRQRVEFGMLTVLTHCSWITGRDVQALAVEFVYPDPPDPRSHVEGFRCPLRFGQGANRALLRTADLALPLSGRNATLATVHEELAERRLDALQGARTSHLVRELIAARAAGSGLSREGVAAALNISSRTLQRRLEEEGTSFLQLRDDTRRELAQRYLREPGSSSLSRVAELLGFEDQSNLFRACKRWFGESPGRYRARFGADIARSAGRPGGRIGALERPERPRPARRPRSPARRPD
ncbi:MAG: AraC family transcriptional regulator [Caldimonas sp.]